MNDNDSWYQSISGHQSIKCSCEEGLPVFKCWLETSGGIVVFLMCQKCFDRLKGTILQKTINDAMLLALPACMEKMYPGPPGKDEEEE